LRWEKHLNPARQREGATLVCSKGYQVNKKQVQRDPEFTRSDNGPELIARSIQDWLAENKIKSIYIDPGCPWQNGYAESFNSRFRIECLDRELPYSLSESRVVFADWRDYYNNI
jgi:transposase InsO family protein